VLFDFSIQLSPGPATDFRVAHPATTTRRIVCCMRPVELRTVADLLDRDHTLGLYCQHCDRWATAPLAKLAARGKGDTPFARFRFRCVACGATGRMQLRPPVLLPATGNGWVQVSQPST